MSTMNLAEIQKTMILLLTDSDLIKDENHHNLTEDQKQFLSQIPHDRFEVYAYGTLGKRFDFSLMIFDLTHKAFTRQEWYELLEQYWKERRNNPAQPIDALAEFPQFLSSSGRDPVWSEFAEYELALGNVARYRDEIEVTNDPRPENLATSRTRVVINPSLRLMSFNYAVIDIAEKLSHRRKPRINRLATPIYLAIYQDPTTRNTRVQQVGSLTARLIEAAQSPRTSIGGLYRLVKVHQKKLDKLIIEQSLAQVIAQLQERGVISQFIYSEQ